MVYCLNPNCPQPENPDHSQFCQSCGNTLNPLLRNRYKVVRSLGRGGFGKTYLAEDADRQNALCVIKQLAPSPEISNHPETFNKAVELFNQEAGQLIKLEDHPQIPTLFAYFNENHYFYLVQQWIEGQTLLEEFRHQGQFNQSKILGLLTDILPILQYVHEHKIIHRDIKPENIIRRRKDQKLILIDFGVAKEASGTLLTQQGTLIGTPGYAPLEQLRGRVCPASDLYSLAVTSIRLMTGCFITGNGTDQLYDPIESCWLWRENLPDHIVVSDELGKILDRLLSDYVKERYQSAAEVLAALQSWGAGETVTQELLTQIPPPVQLTVSQPPSPIKVPPRQPAPHEVASTIISRPPSGENAKGTDFKVFSFETIKVNRLGKIMKQETQEVRYFSEDLGNGVTLELVSIPGGTFMMGSPNTEKRWSGYDGREQPQHQVQIQPYFMSKYPITQVQWEVIAREPRKQRQLNPTPSRFKGKKRPVECVSWYDAIEWCARLSHKTGKKYRLPSEAEWEYGCRAGTSTTFCFGQTLTTNIANYNGNDPYAEEPHGTWRQETTPVGSFPPNAFGLYDCHGNVWEWCADPWHPNYQGAGNDGKVWDDQKSQENYQNLADDECLDNLLTDERTRVLRGGSWSNFPSFCRSAIRISDLPMDRFNIYFVNGFRIVCMLDL